MNRKKTLYAATVFLGALAVALPAIGADTTVKKRTDTQAVQKNGPEAKGDWERGKKELEQSLKSGRDRDFYRGALEKLGYRITSVNKDKADYVEYEVVKNGQSYEVEIQMDESSHKAKEVQISRNLWKAKGTEQAVEHR